MSRRVKYFGGQHQTWPIKDPRELERFMFQLLKKRESAKTPVKKEQADRNWMLCVLGFNTALRAEDLLQIRVKDVLKGYVSIKENKTGKMQNYKMNKQLHDDILDYIQRNNLTEYDYMFMGQKKIHQGKKIYLPITRQQGHKIVSDIADEVGIGYTFGLHSLRKTFGYHYILGGGSWQTLSKMYNHNDIITTQLYVMWDLNDAQKERVKVYIGGVHKK